MPTRAEHRDTTESAIIAAGQRLLAEGGADALTIRGVARELDLVPSALYRYVTKREDLLDLLVQHAHADLAASIQAAHDAVPRADLAGRWRAFAYTMRDWTLAHRHEWKLIQNTVLTQRHPRPDQHYALHVLLLRLGADAEAAGQVPDPLLDPATCAVPGLPNLLRLAGVEVSEQTVLAGLAAWHLLDGVLYVELLNPIGMPGMTEPDAYFEAMVAATERLVLAPPSSHDRT